MGSIFPPTGCATCGRSLPSEALKHPFVTKRTVAGRVSGEVSLVCGGFPKNMSPMEPVQKRS